MKRKLPLVANTTLENWFRKNYKAPSDALNGTLYLYCDEFTNLNDAHIGITAVKLLGRLGYVVNMVPHPESGRTAISKGFLEQAREYADENVRIFSELISSDIPLVGIEPSTILGFRDEYPDLVSEDLKGKAKELSPHCLTMEEFLDRELKAGKISKDQFTSESRDIKLHGHCHQKSLSSMVPSKRILSIPENYQVTLIPSGCCGMAGSFGYEKEHYDLSMQIGELVLFPAVREADATTLIAAAGTSCRHQIKDGTGRKALHPVEILYQALKD